MLCNIQCLAAAALGFNPEMGLRRENIQCSGRWHSLLCMDHPHELRPNLFGLSHTSLSTDVPAQTPSTNLLYGYPRADVING